MGGKYALFAQQLWKKPRGVIIWNADVERNFATSVVESTDNAAVQYRSSVTYLVEVDYILLILGLKQHSLVKIMEEMGVLVGYLVNHSISQFSAHLRTSSLNLYLDRLFSLHSHSQSSQDLHPISIHLVHLRVTYSPLIRIRSLRILSFLLFNLNRTYRINKTLKVAYSTNNRPCRANNFKLYFYNRNLIIILREHKIFSKCLHLSSRNHSKIIHLRFHLQSSSLKLTNHFLGMFNSSRTNGLLLYSGNHFLPTTQTKALYLGKVCR